VFGIVRPCRHRMCDRLHTAWLGHLCGLCLTLRDEHGHRARLTTNYDGLLVSVLLEAQTADPVRYRRARPCALRGFRPATVLSSADPGARLAAAVSLVLAAGKTRDHVADRDGALRVASIAALATRTADRWATAGARTGQDLGFDTAVLTEAVARQTTVEETLAPGVSVLVATEPTETAVAAAFAHTAVLAGMPGNVAPLAEAGRFFGRIAHLLDAVEDYAEDAARGAFNPLRATGTDLAEARRLCDDAYHGLRLALADVALRDRSLVRALLDREVGYAIDRTFALAAAPAAGPRAGDRRGSGAGHGTDPHTAPPSTQSVGPRPEGRAARLIIGGACLLTACTCGIWHPRWSSERSKKFCDRCWCTRDASCDFGCDCCC